MKIMNYDHHLWEEFLALLGMEINENGCNSDTDKPNTRKLLEEWHIDFDENGDNQNEMIDIEKSFEFLEKWGGYCGYQ